MAPIVTRTIIPFIRAQQSIASPTTFSLRYLIRFEKIWNSNKGRFKLAHVCQEWREVVLTSPSRLCLRLLITVFRSGRSIAIRRLPPLPIVIDHKPNTRTWHFKVQQRLISGLAYPDRVCAITFKMPFETRNPNSKVLAAVSQPFPALESLELYCPHRLGSTPPPFLVGQAPQLRHLKFLGGINDFYLILPYTTSLVDLTFVLHTPTFSDETQLLAHLQGITSLRRLELEMVDSLNDTRRERGEVLLPTLTSLTFSGSLPLLNALVADLAAPSLRELRMTLSGVLTTFPPSRAHTHLTSFIRNAGKQFFSIQFETSKHAINVVMSTCPHSLDNQLFRIIASGMCSIPLMGDLFSETLATVEDVFLASPFNLKSLSSPFEDPVPYHTFFMSFRSAKMLRVSPGIEQEIGDIFHHEELPLDLLPSLEEIELNAITRSHTPTPMDENQVAPFLELFRPFVDARQRAGQPVKVHWNADGVPPGYFCDTDM